MLLTSLSLLELVPCVDLKLSTLASATHDMPCVRQSGSPPLPFNLEASLLCVLRPCKDHLLPCCSENFHAHHHQSQLICGGNRAVRLRKEERERERERERDWGSAATLIWLVVRRP